MTECRFFKIREPYGCFSNFYKSEIVVDGLTYATTEHYFQAMKFTDQAHAETVRTAKTPGESARIGRQRHPSYRTDWEQVKDGVMLRAVRAKFAQHHDLRDILLSTGDARIIEHTENDAYWGDGGDGSGKNQLGKTLMLVRFELGGTGIV